MSDAEEYNRVRVSADGVRVLKRFAADEFPVPAIAFDFTSGRDESVTVRLSDTVPDEIDVEDLGFHPDYGSEFWTIEEGRITFEREFEPDATYTTVYGIRAAGDDVEPFLSEPTIEEVDPPLPEGAENKIDGSESEEDIVLESDDALVEDAIASGVENDESADGDTEGIPTLELNEPAAESDASTESQSPAIAADTLVTALAAELRNGSVPTEDVEQLRDALSPNGGSTTARLDQLQRDITDLRAYANALEEFLDENGTGAELIEEFSEQVGAFEEDIERLETEVVVGLRRSFDDLEAEFENLESDVRSEFERVDELASQTEAFDERTDSLAERIDSAAGRTAELTRRFEAFDERTETLESEFEAVSEQAETASERAETAAERAESAEEQTEGLQEQFASVETRAEEMSNEFEAIQEKTDGIDDRFESVESRTDEVAGQAEEIVDRLDELATQTDEIVDRLDQTQSDIEDLREWKEQITQTFGG